MKFVWAAMVISLPWLLNSSWARSGYDDASAEQVLELASAVLAKHEPAVENALRNSIEYAIWSLEERRTPASNRALARLVTVRLGESSTRDRDCAILKRGAVMLEQLRAAEPLVQWCASKAIEMNLKADQVCFGSSDVKGASALLTSAIKQRRQCER